MVKFTLKQCVYFRTVAESGGISQAARALSISQPSVSAAIDKLEAITGLVLFERHHAKGLTLTRHGSLFLEHVKKLEAMAEQVSVEAEALRLEAAGELRLGVFWTLAPFFLPKLIRGFQIQKPKVVIRPMEMSLRDLSAGVTSGKLDLALTYDLGNHSNDLKMQQLAESSLRAYVAADHPFAKRSEVHVDELRKEPYVMLDGPGSRDYFERVFSILGLSPHITFSSTSMETVRSAVASGLGFTFLAMQPPTLQSYDGGRLAALELRPQTNRLKVALASRQGNHESKVVTDFRAHATKFFSDLPR